MSSPQQPLHYSPEPPAWFHRRSTHRAWIIGGCILVIALLAVETPTIRRYVHNRQLIHRLLTHTDPPGTIAIENNVEKAKKLVATDARYALNVSPPTAILTNPEWAELNKRPGMWLQFGVALAHEMISRSGKHRLVVIEAGTIFDQSQPVVCATVIDPDHVEVAPAPNSSRLLPLEPTQSVRAFAGSVDSKNPSHFTLQYQGEDNVFHMIDGWLDDNDKVTFEMQ